MLFGMAMTIKSAIAVLTFCYSLLALALKNNKIVGVTLAILCFLGAIM